MKVEFLARFDKEVDKISDRRILAVVARAIETLEAAEHLK
jgi:hypothetical protein